jgi:hypothetical protein
LDPQQNCETVGIGNREIDAAIAVKIAGQYGGVNESV